jgi:hypothetical protein
MKKLVEKQVYVGIFNQTLSQMTEPLHLPSQQEVIEGKVLEVTDNASSSNNGRKQETR